MAVTTFGMLSTFPPTQCGLATFSKALADQLVAAGAGVSVVRVVDSRQPPVPMVAHQLVSGEPGTATAAARVLNGCGAVVVQHEYGIFGGPDGEDVLDVLAQVRVPLIVVLHTVLAEPTPHQHQVLARVLHEADVAITMTDAGRRRLIAQWGVDESCVRVIPHGAHPNEAAEPPTSPQSPPTILTWGLLGEGKGIEWALEAVALLGDLDPRPRYRIVGQTHPKVAQREGEAYRERLMGIAARLGISDWIDFDARYLDVPALNRIVRSADVVLLPYDSLDQVTSGVLTEAVVAGRPVVSTPFPHAVELLSAGAGALVPRRDPATMAAALRLILTEPEVSERMAQCARDLAPAQLWSTIAREYLALANSLGSQTRYIA